MHVPATAAILCEAACLLQRPQNAYSHAKLQDERSSSTGGWSELGCYVDNVRARPPRPPEGSGDQRFGERGQPQWRRHPRSVPQVRCLDCDALHEDCTHGRWANILQIKQRLLCPDTELQPLKGADGERAQFPAVPGVYAVYDAEGRLQYIGLSRKVCTCAKAWDKDCPNSATAQRTSPGAPPPQVAASLATHAQELPELAHAAKTLVLDNASKDSLTAAWKAWVQAAGESGGQ